MEDKRKEEQEWPDTSVDKEIENVESGVDESEESVDKMVIKKESEENIFKNVDESVDTQEEPVNNSVEAEMKPVETCGNLEDDCPHIVDEPVDNVDNSIVDVEKEEANQTKGGAVWWKVLLGLLAFAGFLAFCWHTTGGGLWKTADIAVTYAKDNGLYVFDLKNDPYLVNDSISDGGEYNYYYSAWGASASEDNEELYYIVGINEDGVGSLYYKDIKNKDAASILIAENVFHYVSSENGTECVYLVKNGDKIDLYLYKDEQSQLIANDILQQNGAYDLSEDSSYVLYKKSNNDAASFYAYVIGEEAPVKLSDSVVLDFIAEKTNITYYLEQQADAYQLFQFVPGEEPQLVAEQVTYAELMPNNQDVFYCAMRAEDTSFDQLIEDDITDLSAYDEKRQAEIEEMRNKMNDEKGMDPIFQDCYVLTSAGKTKVRENVISAASLEGKSGFLIGYSMEAPKPVKLSEIHSFDEALYSYYSDLMYGEKQVFIADKTGNVYTLQKKNVIPTSAQVSNDGKVAAYFVQDENTGDNVLMVEKLGGKGDAVEVQKGVESMGFLGNSEDLVYYYNYNGGLGSLGLYNGKETQELAQSAAGVYFSEDSEEMYYLADLDTTTGNGTLIKFDGKEKQEIDQDVFSFQYKENGKLAYIKNYDIQKEVGELYYYDGKTTRMVDSGVTAIYMY
ncbi:hypothetical protein [Anaerotignum sp.]|uniref:hypothetical protein n=1 Tax=Anaerotignum sp. TaxID=2039241 RepID=UPI002714C3B2|nr:hypothetical protein [Anaerotignum sp.]